MINFGEVTKENIKKHNPNQSHIPDHSYIILLIGGTGSRKINSLVNSISQQPDIDKIYLYGRYPYESKYQLIINKKNIAGLKHLNDSKAFAEYSNDMDDIYKNTEEYNLSKKRKILIVFNDMIANMLSNKKRNPTLTKLIIRGRKPSISLVFITQFYFIVPKNIRLNFTHYFIMKVPNKREIQQPAFNDSSGFEFTNLYKKMYCKGIFFQLLIQLLHQVILHVSERIFQKEYKN